MEKFSDRKWFSFYKYAPTVVAVVLAIACFIVGIYIATIEETGYMFLIWLGGAVVSFITYVSLKIAFSYMLVHIATLDSINSKLDKIIATQKNAKPMESTVTTVKKDELPEI